MGERSGQGDDERPFSDTAGSVLLPVIERELDGERDRKDLIERRGVAVITTSAFLSSLLFALVRGGTPIPAAVRVLVIVTVALLLASAAAGLVANRVRGYEHPKVSELERFTKDVHWYSLKSALIAQDMARHAVEVLAAQRTVNDKKASALKVAFWLQLAAISLVGVDVAVMVILA